MDFFRRVFGFNNNHQNSSANDTGRNHFNENNDENRFNKFFNEGDDRSDNFSFNVFTNPLEMHKYFEHQMNEMLKSFGLGGESFFGMTDPFGSLPSIEENVLEPSNPRDMYLKPGYQSTQDSHKSDGDVDGKVDVGDLDHILSGNNSRNEISPYKGHIETFNSSPKIRFFGQSITSKTIHRSDGTVEIHRTVRDQEGNEETTVTRRKGDQEYSVTTKTDKNGLQEILENLVNLDEKDKDTFIGSNYFKNDSYQSDKTLTDWLHDFFR